MRKKMSANTADHYLLDTFGFFIDAKRASGLAEKTLKNYEQSCGYYFEYMGFDDKTDLKKPAEEDFYKWTNHMRNDDVSEASICHYIRDVRTFFNWCSNKGYREPLEIKEPRHQETEIKIYDNKDLAILLEKPTSEDYVEFRTWAMINLALDSGMRIKSILSLTIDDVDIKQRSIRPPHTKNKKMLEVPMSDALVQVLKFYINAFMSDENPTTNLFVRQDGEELTYNAARLAHERYCNARGVECKGWHAYRHTFATQYLINGGNPLVLKAIMGHATLAQTNMYVRFVSGDLKQGFNDLSPLSQIKKPQSRGKTKAMKK